MNNGDWVIIQNQTGDRKWLNGTVGQITKVCREGLFYEVSARGMSFGFHKESIRLKDGEVRETVVVEDRSGMGWDDIAGQLYFDLGEHIEECDESERMIWEWVKQGLRERIPRRSLQGNSRHCYSPDTGGRGMKGKVVLGGGDGLMSQVSPMAQMQSDLVGLRQENADLRLQLSQMMTACDMHRNDCIDYKNEIAELRAKEEEAIRFAESILETLGPPAKPIVEKVIDHTPIDSPYKLSDLQAQDLRQMREGGATLEAIGEHFNIHYTTVANYLKRESADRTTDTRAEYSVMRDEDR